MKASIYKSYGSPSVLNIEEIPKPIPGKNELLVKVYATTVNRTDCAMLKARPFITRFFTGFLKPKNQILGTDFSGIIEEIGSNVTRFNIDDRILGFNDTGVSSHAEYLCISETNYLAALPGSINFEQAAASIEGAHYAQNFINKVAIKQTDKVFVNGATGAIGSALVQLLIAKGIEVSATADTKNIETIKNLGVKNVIDYTETDFTLQNEKYQFVFDAVGKSTFGKSKKILTKNGVYISSELGPGIQNVFYSLFTPILGGKKVIFPYPHKHQESIDLVLKLMVKGKFKPLVDKVFPLQEVTDAFAYVDSGEKTGNVLLKITD